MRSAETVSVERARRADALGLLLLSLALVEVLNPPLLLLSTISAGGDTPCHYPTAAFLVEQLLPQGRLHGWYPGAYLGHPLQLYYFPLPFLVMALLEPLAGLPVAFKLGSVLGVLLLPLCCYAGFRLMGLRFPAPLLGASAATVFLFLEENPIWGGSIASTLTGEFSYTYGIGLAVVFLGAVYRAYSHGWGPWRPALLLAATALAHGYAVLWAGLSASYFLYGARRPLRSLGWLLGVAALAFALAGFFLVPLIADWSWTTAYDDPWISVSNRNLLPPLLWPLAAAALAGLVATLALARRTGGPDQRLLFLLHAALVGAALAAAGPALGIIDVRFVPFAQLALCLAGAAALGLALAPLRRAELAALGLTLLAVVHGEANSKVLRSWIEWNYSGLEAKPLWPAWRELTARLAGSPADPRVAVEYSKEHERAGSIRMYETLPFFSGRSTLEGVYNQASLSTHPVYYLASELFATSPNPFRNREYASFDVEAALAHLRLFNVRDIVALSERLDTSLAERTDVIPIGRIPPYSVYRLRDHGPGYVEPLSHAPVRSSPEAWRDKAYRWFMRTPLSPALLVFSDDPRFELSESDPWLAPPLEPLDPGVEVTSRLEAERITIETSRPGHPLLVKVSYHPRWKASGADGPFLVSPSLMLVVPRERQVTLEYGSDGRDALGAGLTLGALAFGLRRRLKRGRRRPALEPEQGAAAQLGSVLEGCAPPPPRRWGGVVPAGVVLALAASRLLPAPDPEALGHELYERASQAYSEERYEDAAELARHALGRLPESYLDELETLRGESLLRAAQPEAAAEAFAAVAEKRGSPHQPQAVWGLFRAARARGDEAAAETARERLQQEFAGTPFAGLAAKAENTPPGS